MMYPTYTPPAIEEIGTLHELTLQPVVGKGVLGSDYLAGGGRPLGPASS